MAQHPIARKIAEDIVTNHINGVNRSNIFPEKLSHEVHGPKLFAGVEHPVAALHHHLDNMIKNGGAVTGGGVTGGRLIGGGFSAYSEPPQTTQEMYHFILMMSPHQLEMFREIASQLLGGQSSHMWGPLIDDKKDHALEANPEHYESIVKMPNQHALARMLEAEGRGARGGGFMKALKHVGRIAKKVYHVGKKGLKFVNENKDLLMNFVPEDYRSTAEGALATANKINDTISPLADATEAAFGKNATPEAKEKLKTIAREHVSNAVEKHMPAAKPYVDAANKAYDAYQGHKTKSHPINAV